MTLSTAQEISPTLARLGTRNPGRTEADVQADVRDVLLHGGFDLGEENIRLEAPAPDRRRIDVEVGALVIECKRDLRPKKVLGDGEDQLAGYLIDREGERRGTYVGILTDGVLWRCYRTVEEGVELVSEYELRVRNLDERAFRWWLGSILATERELTPTAMLIEERLGSASPGCKLALRELADLWQAAAVRKEAQIKRGLWAKLLRTALGTQFEDDEGLFLEHTYLVLVATLIAHVVIGFDVTSLRDDAATALSGKLFARYGIRGVGEAGFFDWVLDVAGGADVVADLARRLGVFSWGGVDHDVLKALYQSVISPETRHRLGEYYTPDWLAKRLVDAVVDAPLSSKVLDPACGSGTFLFHAVRRYLEAAKADNIPTAEAVGSVVEHVYGMDLHPVAVVLAQVTYLLALGSERVEEASVPISIPVYLGDSMRWDLADETFFDPSGEVVVPTGVGGQLPGIGGELRFPASVVADPRRFDGLVDELATRAADRLPGDKPLPIGGVLTNYGVSQAERAVLERTYHQFCALHDEGRNHIWGFFVRNQARPTWFTAVPNRVDVVVGNPPWLSYRFMPPEMQKVFERRARERNLWTGGARGRTTQQDLAAFFVARSIELYLRESGRFGFVVPLAAFSRQTYKGFRSGNFSSPQESCEVSFEVPWDLDKVKPDPFRIPSGVVLGTRIVPTSFGDRVPLPTTRLRAAGRIDGPTGIEGLSWVEAAPGDNGDTVYTGANSPYARRFRQGAILVPRMLLFVEEEPSPLHSKTRVAVRSRRARLEKAPWKDVPDHSGVVESIFVRPAYLGEHCLPFRMLDPFAVVIPYDGKELMSGEGERIDRYPGLAEWWRGAERLWLEHRSSDKRSLSEQVDYIGQLSAQLPPSATRVVYTASGSALTSAVVSDDAVIEHKLYWGTAGSLAEARYLTAILNSPVLGRIVEPYQSRGAFGARDFDKYVWYPPTPEFTADNPDHAALVALAEDAEKVAGSVEIGGLGFQRARKAIRGALDAAGVFAKIDEVVPRLFLQSS